MLEPKRSSVLIVRDVITIIFTCVNDFCDHVLVKCHHTASYHHVHGYLCTHAPN